MKLSFKIPSRMWIHKQLWEVDYKWRLHDEAGVVCLSYTDWVGHIIWLDRGVTREDKCGALLTEIIKIASDSGDPGAALLQIFKLTLRSETKNAVSRSRIKR